MGTQLKTFYVYIMASASRTLYTGATKNLERRVAEHQRKMVPGFTRRYNISRLVYYEACGDILAAIAREKQIKSWRRDKKVVLIESMNRDWKDLSATWFGTQGAPADRSKGQITGPRWCKRTEQDSSLRSE
jgi:putative endonuclease